MMNGLLLSLKNEIVNIAPKGRVNCVSPGWVRTPMADLRRALKLRDLNNRNIVVVMNRNALLRRLDELLGCSGREVVEWAVCQGGAGLCDWRLKGECLHVLRFGV